MFSQIIQKRTQSVIYYIVESKGTRHSYIKEVSIDIPMDITFLLNAFSVFMKITIFSLYVLIK